ncbi:MAG: TetR/AcrR family transcriptional regulator, partial [Oscillospiraceae bacterium]|nr:TetR/AcrR family transcriptional regulator [Oscillospiraceae bacterium]
MTKEKILEACAEGFALYGYEGATINQICQKHGISKGLVYY